MNRLKFWKYFWNTLKESKWLLLRYFFVGLYLIIVGIIANLLKLNDLTYYNSMITICYLGEMIAFGFSEGFGIYINQAINEKEKAQKYAKLGLYFTIGLVLVIAIIFSIFPNFILKRFLSLDFELNLTFYYLMIIAMIFMSIYSYINLLLRKIGEFKHQLLTTLIQGLLITLSMVLILLVNTLSLIPIAIIYIISHIVCIVFGNISLTKNNQLKVNLFKFERLKLKKSEFCVVIYRSLAEIVWEIGYMFISLFILRIDKIIYNQYCYFENSLDILNGIFFAFVSVISIKICRAIGEEKKEEAEYQAKNSIKATFVIWLIYALISLSLFIPLKLGMNVELRSTAFVSLILYLIISLLRFTEWNIGTYILGQSEYFVKFGLILEIVFMIYWIILYLIAQLIPTNVYLIYSSIAFENLIKIIISLFAFKNKKWLKRSE